MSELSVTIERIPFGVVSENGYEAQVDKYQMTGEYLYRYSVPGDSACR